MMQKSFQPYLEIVEQPKCAALRFRYITESRKAGNILGEYSTDANPSFPAIKIHNYSGSCVAKMFCVTSQGELHPHKLVGANCHSESGICMIRVQELPPDNIIRFSNVGIQCSKKDDIKIFLEEKKRHLPDCPLPSNNNLIDLTCVHLMFQVYLLPSGILIEPVVSRMIQDKKHCCDLKITRVSVKCATAAGGEELFILCHKVKKEDLEVVFAADNWEGFGYFMPTDVFKECVVVCKVPPYRDLNIDQPVDVCLFLRQLSTKISGDPLVFTYRPVDRDPYRIEEKRMRMNNWCDNSGMIRVHHVNPTPTRAQPVSNLGIPLTFLQPERHAVTPRKKTQPRQQLHQRYQQPATTFSGFNQIEAKLPPSFLDNLNFQQHQGSQMQSVGASPYVFSEMPKPHFGQMLPVSVLEGSGGAVGGGRTPQSHNVYQPTQTVVKKELDLEPSTLNLDDLLSGSNFVFTGKTAFDTNNNNTRNAQLPLFNNDLERINAGQSSSRQQFAMKPNLNFYSNQPTVASTGAAAASYGTASNSSLPFTLKRETEPTLNETVFNTNRTTAATTELQNMQQRPQHQQQQLQQQQQQHQQQQQQQQQQPCSQQPPSDSALEWPDPLNWCSSIPDDLFDVQVSFDSLVLNDLISGLQDPIEFGNPVNSQLP